MSKAAGFAFPIHQQAHLLDESFFEFQKASANHMYRQVSTSTELCKNILHDDHVDTMSALHCVMTKRIQSDACAE